MTQRSFRENPRLQKLPKTQQEWVYFINEANRFIADAVELATAQDNITTLQTDVVAAARSSVTVQKSPGAYAVRSDTSGVFPAGNPTYDIELTFFDESETQVAQRTLRGTLTSASGNISVTETGTPTASSGYSTGYSLEGDGSSSVKATVVLTLPDDSKWSTEVSWNAMDLSTSGVTPTTGGGK